MNDAKHGGGPPTLNLTQFCIQHGLPTNADVLSHIHAGLRSKPTTKTYQRWYDKRLRELQAGRNRAIVMFREAVAAGEIIDGGSVHNTERTAQGHPDNPSTQAAIRLLAKREARRKG